MQAKLPLCCTDHFLNRLRSEHSICTATLVLKKNFQYIFCFKPH